MLNGSAEEKLLINGCSVAIGFSTLGEDGVYKFQKPEKDDLEYIFHLGISPEAAHGWVVRISEDFEKNYDRKTAAFLINPNKPPDWLTSCGGTLDQAFLVLKSLSHQK